MDELSPEDREFQRFILRRLQENGKTVEQLLEIMNSGIQPYDEYDTREMLISRFECKDVADYIISILPEGGSEIRSIVNACYDYPKDDERLVLILWDCQKKSPVGVRNDVLKTIGRLYLDNSMPEKYELTLKALEYYNQYNLPNVE